jgi:branched-subunit amino acid transport protein AzlD
MFRAMSEINDLKQAVRLVRIWCVALSVKGIVIFRILPFWNIPQTELRSYVKILNETVHF